MVKITVNPGEVEAIHNLITQLVALGRWPADLDDLGLQELQELKRIKPSVRPGAIELTMDDAESLWCLTYNLGSHYPGTRWPDGTITNGWPRSLGRPQDPRRDYERIQSLGDKLHKAIWQEKERN
jgi:hypothetical protein